MIFIREGTGEKLNPDDIDVVKMTAPEHQGKGHITFKGQNIGILWPNGRYEMQPGYVADDSDE